MALPASDSFTGITGTELDTYNPNWTTNGADQFQIYSNALRCSTGGDGLAHWNADVFNDDQYSQATHIDTSYYIGLSVRVAASAVTGYYYTCEASDGPYLNKSLAGSQETIESGSTGVSVNDVGYLKAESTTITLLRNGGAWLQQTDSSISSGSAGVAGAASATCRIDDWEGGNLLAESSSVSPSISGSQSLSQSISVSRSISGSASASRSISGSASESRSISGSASVSRSVSSSVSRSVSGSASVSRSISGSASVSRSISGSASESHSLSQSSSESPSLSPSSSESGSISQSSSESSSISPSVSFGPVISGSTCWGHSTDVTESNIRTFSSNWTGTGTISSSGDDEQICLNPGEYMESEIVDTGAVTVTLLQNQYLVGDDILLRYRHGVDVASCLAASWNDYTIPFSSLGFVQIRIEYLP